MFNNSAWNGNYIVPVVIFYVSLPCSLLLDTKESKYTSMSCLSLIFHSTDYYKHLNCPISQKKVFSSETLSKESFSHIFLQLLFFSSFVVHVF